MLNTRTRTDEVADLVVIAAFIAIFAALMWHFAIPSMLDAWDFETCWRVSRQADGGYPVTVPDYCAAHGFEPSAKQ